MASQNFKSAGVSVQEIDLTFSTQNNASPTGMPACVIGTSTQGPAYVPVVVGTQSDYNLKFGESNGEHIAQIASQEWLRNSSALTFVRTLGIGNGEKRNVDGTVTSAGFIIGEKQPSTASTGILVDNPFVSGSQSDADVNTGRMYFLGCMMSASSADSNFFSESDVSLSLLSGSTAPVIRAAIMTARGVGLKLKNTFGAVGNFDDNIGDVILSQNNTLKSDVILKFENHTGSSDYPNVVTASFDSLSNNHLSKVLNTDPLKLQDAGHCLYAYWDVDNVNAVVTSSVFTTSSIVVSNDKFELAAFLVSGSLKNSFATASIPNFENFSNRFTHAKTPFIVSQDFGGKRFNLFKLHSLNDGAGHAEKVKFTIENIVRSTNALQPYGTFDLLIRDINDTDTNKIILEQFRGINLDPSSDRYISKVIGDTNIFFNLDKNVNSQALEFEGNFPNRSIFVRVEVSEDLENGEVPEEALPFGFRGMYHLATSGSSPLGVKLLSQVGLALSGSSSQLSSILQSATVPPVQMRKNIAVKTGLNKTVEPALCWGIQFESVATLEEPNRSSQRSKTVLNFMKYFPDFGPDGNVTVWVGDNEGVADTAANGILDADRFQNNLFTLENIHVVTNSSGVADHKKWHQAVYNKKPTHTESGKRKLVATDLTQNNRDYLKFNFVMQGGFDGVNIFDQYESKIDTVAVEQDMLSAARGLQSGPNVISYTKAIDIISNTSEVEFKLLAVPGIRHSTLTNKIIDVVEERFDAIYLMDIEEYDDSGNKIILRDGSTNVSVVNTVSEFNSLNLNTSFAAAYFPDLNILDRTSLKSVRVPPSVAVLGAFSLNDNIGHPWFAPAGFTRGALQTTLETAVKLSQENIDALYDADINPLIAFPGNSVINLNANGGVVIWGQKTLLKAASTLDRVNVRRLLIEIRRSVREIANTFIFEPAREETLRRFSAAVQPRLQRIRNLGGMSNFQVIIDTSTTTQADIEANTIRGKVLIQPVKSLEFVSIDFVVANQLGA